MLRKPRGGGCSPRAGGEWSVSDGPSMHILVSECTGALGEQPGPGESGSAGAAPTTPPQEQGRDLPWRETSALDPSAGSVLAPVFHSSSDAVCPALGGVHVNLRQRVKMAVDSRLFAIAERRRSLVPPTLNVGAHTCVQG